VIDYFYRISEKLLGCTSSLTRDSNAYLAVEWGVYASFANNDENNPTVLNERLFKDEEYKQAFLPYNKQNTAVN